MDNLLWLGRIHPSERSEVGDKAFYLNEAARQGYPIAPGLVVRATTLPTWLQRGNWQEPLLVDLLDSSLHVNIDEPDELQALAQKIRHQLLITPLPEGWIETLASGAASWKATTLIFRPSLSIAPELSPNRSPNLSQLLESHLSANQPEDLALALKLSWAELFRARSLFCTQRYGISLKQVRLGILVQPVERAIASGTLKSRPTGFEIRATVGASLAITNGDAIPDSYQVDAQTGRIQSQQLGRKTCTYEVTDIGWEPQILNEAQQQQYALAEPDLATLIELAQKLMVDLTPYFQIEWIRGAAQERECESEPTSFLRLTRVDPLKSVSESTPMTVDRPPPSKPPSKPQWKTQEDRGSIRGIAVSSGVAMAQALTVEPGGDFPESILPGRILVAATISPDWLPQIQQVAGLVTERGGTTSHGAILARELGIPAVVGIANATQRLTTGEWIQIDGDRGEVHRMSEAAKTEPAEVENRAARSPLQPRIGEIDIPIATQLFLNLSQPSAIERVVELPVDGVGLIRGERMAIETFNHPNSQPSQGWTDRTRQSETIEKLVEHLSSIARSFAPRPIYYRSHNFSDDDRSPSALGIQGTFRIQLDPTVFEWELTAIAQVRNAGYTNLHLILPFVRTVEEFEFCRQRVDRADLLQDGSFELWIMAEVPSVVFLLPDFVRAGVRGITIGSNDLTQLIFGADRDRPQMSRVFEARHPAVLRAMEQLVKTARSLGIPCSICGDAPVQYPELIDCLVEWGITGISVPPHAVESTYRAIARAERRLLLAAARRQLSEAERSGRG